MAELSKAQQKAITKLTHEWQSAYTLKIGLNTLNSLIRRGLVEDKGGLGTMFFPRTIEFRLKEEASNE